MTELRRQRIEIDIVQGKSLEFAIQHRAARGEVRVVIHALEPRAYFLLRAMGDEKSMMCRQPIAARFFHFAGEDFDAVAAGRLEIQRDDADRKSTRLNSSH